MLVMTTEIRTTPDAARRLLAEYAAKRESASGMFCSGCIIVQVRGNATTYEVQTIWSRATPSTLQVNERRVLGSINDQRERSRD